MGLRFRCDELATLNVTFDRSLLQIVVNDAPDLRDPNERARMRAMAHSFSSTRHTIGDDSLQFWLLEMERYYASDLNLTITDSAFYGMARHYFAAKSTEM